MKPGIAASQILGLQFLDRLDGLRRDDMTAMVDPCQFFQGIEKQCCTCPQKMRSLSGDHAAVCKLQGSGRLVRFFGALQGSIYYRTVMDGDACLIHQHFDFIYFFLCTGSDQQAAQES